MEITNSEDHQKYLTILKAGKNTLQKIQPKQIRTQENLENQERNKIQKNQNAENLLNKETDKS